MNTIWKYTLELGSTEIEMPEGARILAADMQNDQPCLWVMVVSDNPLVKRTFVVVGTGHPYDGEGEYIGTMQALNGALVWHVFERPEFMMEAVPPGPASEEERGKEGKHISDGQFQSDKYPDCPRGLVPFKVTDRMAQDLLWEYTNRRAGQDPEFSADLQELLLRAGYDPESTYQREMHT